MKIGNFENFEVKSFAKPLALQTVINKGVQTLGEEVGKIISVQCNIAMLDSECLMGEIRYNGKVCISVIFLNSNGNICTFEIMHDFNDTKKREDIMPDFKARIVICIENTNVKMQDGQIMVTCIISGKAEFLKSDHANILTSGDLIEKKMDVIEYTEPIFTHKHKFIINEEFEINDTVYKILKNSAKCVTENSTSSLNTIVCEGKVYLLLYCKTENEIKNFTEIIPFKLECECDYAFMNMSACSVGKIKNVKIDAVSNEDKKKTLIKAEIELEIECELYDKKQIDIISDCFSKTHYLNITRESMLSHNLKSYNCFNDKLSMAAQLHEQDKKINKILTVMESNTTSAINKIEDGKMHIEGIVSATLIFLDDKNEYNSMFVEAPYSIQKNLDNFDNNDIIYLDLTLLSLDARQKSSSEIEIFSEMTVCLKVVEEKYNVVISDVEVGEERVVNTHAVSICVLEKGETLFEVAKNLGLSEGDVLKANPNIEFPLSQDEQILIYKQL